jgi:hypothetical protein
VDSRRVALPNVDRPFIAVTACYRKRSDVIRGRDNGLFENACMVEKAATLDRFNWRLLLYAAVAGLIFSLAAGICGGIVELLYFFVAAPIVSLVVLVVAARRKGLQRLSAVSTVAVYCAVSWVGLTNSGNVRTAGRWFLWSKAYKAEVLAQPDSVNGELRHIEWDGWGFPGAGDTVVYLVFDPRESLSAAAKSHSHGKFIGIPCDVPLVRRLENQWYVVVFYTDTSWGLCS